MKKRSRITAALLCVMLMLIIPISVSADTGPKPSVRILFENMGDELCYGTLLSASESTGPNSVWDGNEEHIYNYDLDIEIWRAFVEYDDADGYHYLQTGCKVSETKEIAWTYYPPDSFKILLYYPEFDRYIVSGICERYAFDTYYTVDMKGVNIGSVDFNEELSNNDRINAYRSYNLWREYGGLAARIVITIAVELAIALLFGLGKGKQLLLIVPVNFVTQILLNIFLSFAILSSELRFIILYVLLEASVVALEALIYCKLMNRLSDTERPNWYYTVYSLAANVASFGAGLLLAPLIPSVF